MKVKDTDIKPRYDRYDYQKPVKVITRSGETFEAQSKDVSRSGMALTLQGPVMENGQFLDLHTEGLGNQSGRVVRTYDGGAALQFKKLLTDDPDPEKLKNKLNELA